MKKNVTTRKEAEFEKLKKDYASELIGSTVWTIVSYTKRIQELTEHLSTNRKDKSAVYSLTKIVSSRKKFLKYLHKSNLNKYHEIINHLNLKDIFASGK